jgi:hypothetical protein
MAPDNFYHKLLSYGIPQVEVVEYLNYDFLTICDLSYDFRAAIFDIDETIYYDEIERAAHRMNGWLPIA